SGKDGNLIQAQKLSRTTRDPDSNIEKILDLGFVGEPTAIDPKILTSLQSSDIIPVIAPIGVGSQGETYNINADTVAGAIAAATHAARLLLLTDVIGVLDKSGELIPDLNIAQLERLRADGTISGGMIPKIESCIDVIAEGVEGVVIINGKVPHAVLLELFTEHGAGTLIERRRRKNDARGSA
ncbi:MAG: acetylglutamate kinase, partial [Methyloceanibacter sp.]